MPTLNRSIHLILIAACLGVTQPRFVLAQANTLLPTAEQEAVEKGVFAAQQQEYPLAIRYFQNARKIAPASPMLLFNLGLAESKITGRELRAMTWFGAYLSASPDADNVAAIQRQIRALDVKNEVRVNRLIRGVEDAARQFSETGERQRGLRATARLWALTGNVEEAARIAAELPAGERADTLRDIAAVKAESRDSAGPQQAAGSQPDAKQREAAPVAMAQAGVTTPGAGTSGAWIRLNDGLLSEADFTDPTAVLRALPAGDAGKMFRGLAISAERLIEARLLVLDMLRQLAAGEIATPSEKRLRKLLANGAGSGPAAGGDSLAPAMVRISGKDFEIGKFEVTQAQWIAVMGSNPSQFPQCGDSCPVDSVTWEEIQIYLQRLKAMTGKHYRLPTDDEWLLACHGGTPAKYCGGDDIERIGWFAGNSGDTTHPVGQKQANAYGIHDMSGGVWEWTGDCADAFFCEYRALRGGSWNSDPGNARADHQGRAGPRVRDGRYGFRLARSLP